MPEMPRTLRGRCGESSLLRTVWQRISEVFAATRRGGERKSYASFWLTGIDNSYKGELLMDHDQDDAGTAEVRAALGQTSMNMMDLFDADLVKVFNTYIEHVQLMKQEMLERGMEAAHAAQIITGVTVGVLVDA